MPLGIVKESDYIKELGNVSPETETSIPKEEDLQRPESEQCPSDTDSSNSEGLQATISSILDAPTKGRGVGKTGVPQGIRQIIGEAAIKEGNSAASAIGAFLGLSQSSVSAYQKGATSTASYNKPDKELLDHLTKTRQKITKRASGKLLKALNVIDDDKLNVLTAVEASGVAKNMAAVIKQMEPEQKQGNVINGPVITFYAPHMVKEEQFDVITVSE